MKAFISYSHQDRELLTALHEHLAALHRQGLLITWTDRQIPAGGIIDDHVGKELEEVELYLLLISSAFIKSNYCYEREFARALERHKAGEVVIVPIIVRDCDWNIPELRQFKALPEDGRAVTGRMWVNAAEAFANVAQGLRELISQSPSKPKKKGKKDDFVPDDRHVTSEQREELRKIGEEIVERQTVNTLKMTTDKARKVIGRQFAFLWDAFGRKFEIKERGLKSLPRERYAEAKSWLQQYRASNDAKLKTAKPQKFRNSILGGIFGISKKLVWTDEEIHAFASKKLGMPVDSLTELRNDQLGLVRDGIRYEMTKLKRNAAKAAKESIKKADG